ncbi:MAG TPA: thiamine phosphate synthase [Longimicrobiales bacterium]
MSGNVADLRLIIITDERLAAPRAVRAVVEAALEGGAPAIQLRNKTATARTLYDSALDLLPIVRAHGALLFINDRLDVALAARTDGVHLGPGDMPVAAARSIAPRDFLIGFSTDDPDTARAAERAGASYIGCGAVFGTTSKAEVGDERIGTERLAQVAQSVRIPVIAIGGIHESNIHETATAGARGAAVIGAVMKAEDPAAAVRALLARQSGIQTV